MNLFKSLLSVTDAQINSFSKILDRKLGLFAAIAPNGTTQEMLYRVGFDGIGKKLSPSNTLSTILKEYAALHSFPLDTQISLIETRVFSKLIDQHYPNFNNFEDWIAWRMTTAFPKHNMTPSYGWTPEFYRFAMNRALEHFV